MRVTGRVRDPKAFADVVVAVRQRRPDPGARHRDGDRRRADKPRRRRRSIGEAAPSSLDVLKISGTNTVEVADSVRAAVADLSAQSARPTCSSAIMRDDSQRIRESLADVQLTLVLGAVLTITIIYLFLNSWRSTVITGLTLPVSIISAFFIMWVFDFTLNTMTLLALSLAIGLLIDDAIVVRENIVRHIEMGKDHYRPRAGRHGRDRPGRLSRRRWPWWPCSSPSRSWAG